MQVFSIICISVLIFSTSARRIRRPGGGHRRNIPFHATNNDACDGKKIFCDKNKMYRTITGVCNNLKNPYLGAANSLLTRLLAPEYYDCKEVPKGGYVDKNKPQSLNGRQGRKFWKHLPHTCPGRTQNLPNVREVSDTFHPEVDLPQSHYSLMVMQFGQFLDHDMALTPEVEPEQDCCAYPDTEDCFPINILDHDSFFASRFNPQTCMEFARSDAFCPQRNTEGIRRFKNWIWRKKSTREQYNILTSFVDGSQIYSPNEVDAKVLRGKDGKLKTMQTSTDKCCLISM